MKNFIKGLIVVAVSLVIVPLIPLLFTGGNDVADENINDNALPAISDKAVLVPYSLIDTVSVYDVTVGKRINYSCEDFLVYTVMAAVSPNAEAELLKAQAVLMYTYILGRRLDESVNPTPELFRCDISTDSNKYIRILSADEVSMVFKDNADEYTDKVRKAVKSVMGEYVSYKSKPIVPAYCYSCGGVTESSLTVLGTDVEYLRSVKSAYDEGFKSQATMTKDELFARVSTQTDAPVLLGDPKDWINLSSVTSTGYVSEVTFDGGEKVSGQQFAQWLNLPSARFEVTYSEEFERFNFDVSGSGHLVGMSQYGANEMAKNGFTYRKILTYFFSGVDIERSLDEDVTVVVADVAE